jgi:hypothetical protein
MLQKQKQAGNGETNSEDLAVKSLDRPDVSAATKEVAPVTFEEAREYAIKNGTRSVSCGGAYVDFEHGGKRYWTGVDGRSDSGQY